MSPEYMVFYANEVESINVIKLLLEKDAALW